jgi:hypothetical protein
MTTLSFFRSAIPGLVAAFTLSACGGGGAPTSTTPQSAPTSAASSYTGPAAATADVLAFQNNFWVNVRSQNRCGQCHNATTPAQMPNFARSDDVNLAYAQANTVVNLGQPSTSIIVTKVAGGHNCWLADPNACGQILTTWISNWANATSGGGKGTVVALAPPPVQSVGQSLNFPASAADFNATVYPLLSQYCARCHSPNAAVPQSPYFASPALSNGLPVQAYQAAIPKINLNTPNLSRFYERLANESHNCWSNCASNAATMLAAIQSFAGMLTPSSIDPSLVVSKALNLSQGTVASGASRFDANVIAKYEFQTGNGYVAYDTSGVDPEADLTITGNVTWAGGWGINIGAGGKAQVMTAANSKFYSMIQSTGEFSIEAWVAPALVATPNPSYIVSYSGSDASRDFTLGQTNQQYDFMLRSSSGTGLNGMPQLQTPVGAMALQASLQHVVLTFDPVKGRQIYVNGVSAGVTDPQAGGALSNWDSTFALVLGNEVSGDRPWQGLIKFVAIHNRALTASQILQNYNAGVGERFFMLFNVESITNVSKSYVMFTVSQYDSSSYLFNQPAFISLDSTVTSANLPAIPVQGIRIGVNGTVPNVGQAYIPLKTTVTAQNYTPQGEVLSNVGTVIPLQNGPLTDQFFLTFDVLGSAQHVVVEPAPAPPPPPAPLAPVADVGVRTFAEINATMSQLTGVPASNPAVNATYLAVQQQLPAGPTLESFLASNQVGIAQLAIQYCTTLVSTPSLAAKVFPGVAFGPSQFASQGGISTVTGDIAAMVLGGGQFNSQPAASTVTTELNSLIGALCTGSSPCNSTQRVQAVAAAACAAALGSADMEIE